ncbi:hypothetical protein FA15DRAFT_698471 [Coprinopsis marcescibilis]|uniref:Uncharacterized protein n=1 Tax=Coprinopsis marcescibilis TaxID=230819 RepID=A0A5C3KBC9_COPMA|nr:hypothetical protein FA15DRAFT_698471 [Coprinopsis marcescibilis]
MTTYPDRVREQLQSLLDDPRSFPTARGFCDRLHTNNPMKPSEDAAVPSVENNNYERWCFKNGDVATIKAVLQVQPLTPDDALEHCYPDGIIKSSEAALKAILFLQSALDKKRPGLPDANIIHCVRTLRNQNQFVLVLTSHLIFPSLQLGNDDSIPSVTLDDLDDDETPLSPSGTSRPTQQVRLRATYSPSKTSQTGLYGECIEIADTKVEPPKIFNGKGELVHPKHYNTLPAKFLAIVEASICTIQFKPEGESHDKRVTHLRLESLRILDQSLMQAASPEPDAEGSPTPQGKRKRKRKSPTKPKTTRKKQKTRASTSKAAEDEKEEDETLDEMEMDEDENL